MPTFSELRTRVQRRVIDLPTAVQDEVPGLVNKALKELQTRHNFKVMEAIQAYVTQPDVRALNLPIPTNLKEVRGRPWRVANDEFSSVKELTWAPSEGALRRRFGELDIGSPLYLLDPPHADSGIGTYEVWPLSDALSDWDDGEYRIYVPYWKYLPTLAADGDTNWFCENAEWYIVNQATSDAFFIDWDESRASVWAQLAQAEFGKVLQLDKRNRIAQLPDTFVPYKDVYEAPLRG